MKDFLQRMMLVGVAALSLAGCAVQTTVAVGRPAPVASEVTTHPAQGAIFINVHALIIVRHADIDVEDKKTLGAQAPLTAHGLERAKALAYALKDAGITRIVTSETLRTQQTAHVLAEELGLTLDTPFGHGGVKLTPEQNKIVKKQEAATVAHYLAETGKPDETILLVHHHSVIPNLMKELGYAEEPPIVEDEEFDRLYVVLPDPETHTYHILRLRYGGKWGE